VCPAWPRGRPLPSFTADYNARFCKPPANSRTCIRPLRMDDASGERLAWKEERTSRRRDFQYDKVIFYWSERTKLRTATQADYRVDRPTDGYQSAIRRRVGLRTFDTMSQFRRRAMSRTSDLVRLGQPAALIAPGLIAAVGTIDHGNPCRSRS